MKAHWEHIYETKTPEQVSWTQSVPEISLKFIQATGVAKDAAIIDVGGGDSRLVDFLLDLGYTNLSVLDISSAAIQRAQNLLGERASQVNWIVSDVLDFRPTTPYDLWHDRAAFHFQVNPDEIESYLQLVQQAVAGHLIVGTFSTDGPLKCSGLPIHQYSESDMKALFLRYGFSNTTCERENHLTPSGAVQNFVFCGFITE